MARGLVRVIAMVRKARMWDFCTHFGGNENVACYILLRYFLRNNTWPDFESYLFSVTIH